jgi:hypothetical protein
MGLNRLGSRCYFGIKKESTYATYITPDVKLRVKSSSVESKPTVTLDDCLIGSNMDHDSLVTGFNVGGNLEFEAFHPNEMFLLQGVWSDESAVSDPFKSIIIITYNGASPYSRLSLVGTDLIAEKATTLPTWSADTSFGTAGTLALGTSTVAQVVALITAYTGWDAVYFGTGTELATTIPAFAVTNIKTVTDGCIPLVLQSTVVASTVAKTHNLARPTTNNLPSFSILEYKDLGTNKSIAYLGNKINTFTISKDPQKPIKATFGLIGRQALLDQTDVPLTASTTQAINNQCRMIIIDQLGNIFPVTEVKKISLQVNPNLHDSKVIDSQYISEPDYQNYAATLTFDLGNNAVNWPIRPYFEAGTRMKAYVFMSGTDYADATNTIPYSMFFAMPSIGLENYSCVPSTRDKLMITGSAKVFDDITCKTVDIITSTY